MKNFLALLLSLLFSFALFSCDNKNDGTAEGSYTLNGTVTKIGVGYISVLGNDGIEEGTRYRVNLTSDTIYEMGDKRVTISSLSEGATVAVSYNGMTTRSIPPQINAEKVVIEAKKNAKTAETPENLSELSMTATVTSLEADCITVTVLESEYATGTYIVHVPNTIEILSSDGDEISLSDIKVGDTVRITYGDLTMLSLPPQIIAESITVN